MRALLLLPLMAGIAAADMSGPAARRPGAPDLQAQQLWWMEIRATVEGGREFWFGTFTGEPVQRRESLATLHPLIRHIRPGERVRWFIHESRDPPALRPSNAERAQMSAWAREGGFALLFEPEQPYPPFITASMLEFRPGCAVIAVQNQSAYRLKMTSASVVSPAPACGSQQVLFDPPLEIAPFDRQVHEVALRREHGTYAPDQCGTAGPGSAEIVRRP